MAAAGTGKTAIIAERFRLLVAAGVEPDRILVMTFSERAATGMRERIRAAGVDDAANVGTFHSLALRWLREDGARVGLRAGFRILAGPERWIFMRELMWELGSEELIGVERPDDQVGDLLKMQERLKQELIPVERLLAWATASRDQERAGYFQAAAELFREHGRRCRSERLVEFDDLILFAVRLLEADPQLRSRYATRFPWVMVDEYQDTNLAQERLVELLGQEHGNVFVVGDDDQSIYRFRGASRASMDRFQAAFPASQHFTLGRNRRSSAPIVRAAAALIGHNRERLAKDLAPAASGGLVVRHLAAATGEDEAAAIAARSVELVDGGQPPQGIAILTRTNAIARPLLTALESAGVPFHHWGAQGFYQRPEVRDLVAHLLVLRDPDDLVALARAASSPAAGLDLDTVVALGRGTEGGPSTLLARLGAGGGAAGWVAAMDLLRREATRLGMNELFFELMSETGYLERALAAASADGDRILANVSRFGELIDDFCENHRDQSLGAFLDHLTLVLGSGIEEDAAEPEPAGRPAVQVMTIHQAKGLEFDVVFLPCLVDRRLPQPRRQDRFELPTQILEPAVRGREDHLAEERRLCYVAMTRARRRLYLTSAETYEGGRAWRPSRFLAEAGPEVRQERAHAVGGATGPALTPAPAPAPGPALLGAVTPVSLSFSAASTYRECPRQYRFRYLLRLPPRRTVESQFGIVMHSALMELGRLRIAGRRLDSEAVDSAYAQAWQQVELAEPRRRPVLERVGRAQLDRYLAAGGLAAAPAHVEESFTATLDGWRLAGIIDRIDPPNPPPTQIEGGVVGSAPVEPGGVRSEPGETGAWRIVDYKTGAPLPASRLRRDLQLLLYALGAREALGLDPVELELVYLKDGRSVRIPAGDDLLEAARQACAEVAAGIRAGNFEPRPERRRCRLCSYRLLCDSAL